MAIFFLFLITGLVTVLPVMYMFAGAWMGVPIIPTEYASIAGSCLLMSSAYVSLFSRKQASVMAFIGILAIGSFWCIEPIKALWSGEPSVGLLVLLGLIWLTMAASLTAAVKGVSMQGHEQAKVRSRKVTLSISVVLLFTLIIGIEWQHKASERTPSRYEIPDGYVGWVEIQYDIPGATVTSIRDKQFVFSIPASGLLKTSTSQQFGEAHDHYLYCRTTGCKELPDTGWGKGGMIWAESSGTFEEPGKPDVRKEHFFVGTESQYKKMQNLSTIQEGIVAGDIKAKL